MMPLNGMPNGIQAYAIACVRRSTPLNMPAAVQGRMTKVHLKQTCCVWGPSPRLQGGQRGPLHAQPWPATQRGPAAAGQDALCALHTQQLCELPHLMRCVKLALQRQPQTSVRLLCCMSFEENMACDATCRCRQSGYSLQESRSTEQQKLCATCCI